MLRLNLYIKVDNFSKVSHLKCANFVVMENEPILAMGTVLNLQPNLEGY